MIEIASSVLAHIAAHIAHQPDFEVCGLLFGSAERVERARACRNVADRPSDSFEIDPAELLAAYRAARAGDTPLVGWYHSHPSGSATPSLRDAEAAAPDGKLWLIAAGAEIRAFRAGHAGSLHGRFEPVLYHVVHGV